MKKYKEIGSVEEHRHSGWPRRLSAANERHNESKSDHHKQKAVWGYITANGCLNAEKYRQILIHNNAITQGRCIIDHKFILQSNNDPKHTAKVIKNYL